MGLSCWGPDMSEGYAKLLEACEPHGMVLFHQLWHAGHNWGPIDGSLPWSASDLPGISGIVPIPMTQAMMDEVIASFADAARKCVALGTKGVEIHCAHGYLLAHFMSANTNDRTDQYSGSTENRLRFPIEVVRAVRAAVPAGYPVGVRVAPDVVPGGIDVELCTLLCQKLEAEGLIDFVDCSLGNYETWDTMWEGMHEGAGYQLKTSGAIARAVKSPRSLPHTRRGRCCDSRGRRGFRVDDARPHC
ncbi:MAG: hypothetical protein KIT60_03585 [Burkholderiaceae bacterium]|nr:hypothetical protein [Burkholderiaceae bacterium]